MFFFQKKIVGVLLSGRLRQVLPYLLKMHNGNVPISCKCQILHSNCPGQSLQACTMTNISCLDDFDNQSGVTPSSGNSCLMSCLLFCLNIVCL